MPRVARKRVIDFDGNALALGICAGYQILALRLSGLTIGSPDLHPNALANCGMLARGPFTRYSPGECGSV
jgi:hypothetical protein